MKTEGRPIFQLGFCGDWVELRKTMPAPEHEGEFSLVFRKKRKRKYLPLFTGLTIGGVEAMIEKFRGFRYDPTALCNLIAEKCRQLETCKA